MQVLRRSALERVQLQTDAQSRASPAGVVSRATVILFAADGLPNADIAAQLTFSAVTVGNYRRRWFAHGLAGWYDAPRHGRPRTPAAAAVARLLRSVWRPKPATHTQWSVRAVADATQLPKSTVQRYCAVFGVQPYRAKSFTLSTDPFFIEKVRHLDANVPAALDVHLIVDTYATHKQAHVKNWLAERPRYHGHYTPTYRSWLNPVERWFGLIAQRAIRRGSFSNVRELGRRLEHFVDHDTATSRPFKWMATADSALEKPHRLLSRSHGPPHHRVANIVE